MIGRFLPPLLGISVMFAAAPAAAQDRGEAGMPDAVGPDLDGPDLDGPDLDGPDLDGGASGTVSGPPDNVFAGDWITIGIGAGYGPSYSGSDDYVLFPAPVVQGKISGIGIQPRPAGLAVDLIDDRADAKVNFAFGPTVRLRNDRASQIKDPVVSLAGKLDRAVEVGAAAGISFPKLLSPYDSLSFNLDTRWDVAGAHKGMVMEPNISYFTPLSRGMAASLAVSTQYGGGRYNRYYYSVTPAQSAASGLPEFQAKGGINSIGTNLILGIDFDGNLQNGGLSGVIITGYSRLVGDARNTPYTRLRGSADQFLGALAIGYTF